MEEGKLPPFASGKITSDYSILFEYWKVAREKGREDLIEGSMLSEDDYKLLVEEAGKSPRLDDLLEALADKFLDRIDPDIAVEAVRRATGATVESETARRLVARLLASWLVEAGEYWNMIRFRGGRGGGQEPESQQEAKGGEEGEGA